MLSIPAMTWFFFISAYLFFRHFNMEMLTIKCKKRIRSIFVPYIIWNTMSAALLFVRGGTVDTTKGIIELLRMTYIFWGAGCANGPLWYMFR